MVVVTIKRNPPINTNIKTPFFNQNKSQHFHLGRCRAISREDLVFCLLWKTFFSINAFLKVNLMKKYDFEKSCQLGFVFVVQGMSN